MLSPLTSLLGFAIADRRRPVAAISDRSQPTWANGLAIDELAKTLREMGGLMAAAQGGERQAYDQLFRELCGWLRRYYARRLPPAAAEDARQDALLAIHANRNAYSPSRPFGPWVAAIARYKWIDHVRDVSRFAGLSLRDDMPIENCAGEPAMTTMTVDDLLRQLRPAQARVIRLVKLEGASIEDASQRDRPIRRARQSQYPSRPEETGGAGGGDAVTPTRTADSATPRNRDFTPHASKQSRSHGRSSVDRLR